MTKNWPTGSAWPGIGGRKTLKLISALSCWLPWSAVLVATFTGHRNILTLGLILGAAGFFAPDIFLFYAISKRKTKLNLALPDATDLLVICMEAGLGLDQAVLRVAEEMEPVCPELSEELLIISREQRAGKPRIDAWRSMANRVDLDSVRQFVAMLVQTEKFGTPIARASGAVRRFPANEAAADGGGERRQDDHQAGLSAGVLYLSRNFCSASRPCCNHVDAEPGAISSIAQLEAVKMDNVLMIRVIAGVVAVILLAVIVGRRKRMAAAKHAGTKY